METNLDYTLLSAFGAIVALCWAVYFFMYYISRRPSFYEPERVIIEREEKVLVSHLPIANIHRRFGKTVLKSTICKVQLAGNYVTLFNKSGNAIDIWVPQENLAGPIFERARALFAQAEFIEIDC